MWSKRVFVYTGTSFQKKTTQLSPVHATTIMSSQGQPSKYHTAEIESAASSMKTIYVKSSGFEPTTHAEL